VQHRKPELITEAVLTAAIARTPLDHYVIWTGQPCGRQRGSLRERALSCISEVGEPVALRALIRRAAAIEADRGLQPDLVRGAVRLHQLAKPAVYLLVRRTPLNEFVAVSDIPFPGSLPSIRAGQLIVDRDGRYCLSSAAGLGERSRLPAAAVG
jgi:hypothetical protein